MIGKFALGMSVAAALHHRTLISKQRCLSPSERHSARHGCQAVWHHDWWRWLGARHGVLAWLLHGFSGGDGSSPFAALVKVGSLYYGTTLGGGNDGSEPVAARTYFGGSLFGITKVGGASGAGTVFRVNTNGTGHVVRLHLCRWACQ
jgi:uncharacterized repeat protein (TIGR03803 family)